MANKRPDPLQWNVPIVDPQSGMATPFFIRQWQGQYALNGDFSSLFGLEFIADDGLTGGGTLGDLENITFALDQEFVRDLVGAMFVDSSNIDFTVNDGADSVTADLTDTGVTPGEYGDDSNIPVITVDAKGRITEIDTVPAAGGGGGGGGSAWELAGTWDHSVSGDTAFPLQFTGLGSDVDDILVVVDGLAKSVAGTLGVQISDNNGTSYFAGSNYTTVVAGGGTSAASSFLIQSTNQASARYTFMHLWGAQTPRPVVFNANTSGMFLGTLSGPINAIQVITNNAANATGGVVRVYVKRT